jgi:hypothetical protein
MKYFTPEKYLRLQDFSSDAAMDAAEKAWEQARLRYQRHLKKILSRIPRSLRALLEAHYLHDAEVLSMGQQGKTFVIVIRLDAPPREQLILSYQLTEEALIHKGVLPTPNGDRPMRWLYDEIGVTAGKKPSTSQAILFSNGWEVHLRFRNLHVVSIHAVYPGTEAMTA